MPTANEQLRQLPSVDILMNSPAASDLVAQYGREMTLQSIRAILDAARARIQDGDQIGIDESSLIEQVNARLEATFRPTLRPVINATGVIIHTNLGRVLLSKAAQAAMLAVAGQYNTLEFNLKDGKRGSRYIHADALLREITGAEAALVVNNNASALVLLLSALAKDREVIISRGQLVEIGGGFRVPEIMSQSGGKLVEIGATNRTRIEDYERAITDETALLMRVHSSNFKQIGFVEEAALEDLTQLAQAQNLHLVDDLGSGALVDTAQFGLAHEPTVQESLAAGVDLVAFSGDKLLGGPQSGILVGKQDIINQLKRHPLARAVRADKLCYAALNATLDHYRKGEVFSHIPIWQMISRPLNDIRETAERWAEATGGTVIEGESTVGGGSLPGATLPTTLLALDVSSAEAMMTALRDAPTPVIARVVEGQVLFDPRTVLPEQEEDLLEGILTLS